MATFARFLLFFFAFSFAPDWLLIILVLKWFVFTTRLDRFMHLIRHFRSQLFRLRELKYPNKSPKLYSTKESLRKFNRQYEVKSHNCILNLAYQE